MSDDHQKTYQELEIVSCYQLLFIILFSVLEFNEQPKVKRENFMLHVIR